MPLAEQQTKMPSVDIEAVEMLHHQANLLLGTVLLVMVVHLAGGLWGKGLCEVHANGTFNRHIAMI
jgi:hypothetical protein